jgi:hypothetical protein
MDQSADMRGVRLDARFVQRRTRLRQTSTRFSPTLLLVSLEILNCVFEMLQQTGII